MQIVFEDSWFEMTNPDLQLPIKNFRKVNDWLYRGGQPSINSLSYLKHLNIKTVISLRWQKIHVVQEQTAVTELGMKFVNIAINYWTMPSQNNIDEFLKIIDEIQYRPIFVHCLHGADRTGFLIAIFRIMRSGWTFNEAYKEMMDCGYHRFRIWHYRWRLWQLARQVSIENQR